MGTTARSVLGGAVLLLLLGALAWMLFDTDVARVGPTAAIPDADAVPVAPARPTDVAGGRTDPARVALPESAPSDTALLHPFAFSLEVQLVDRLGLPIRGARVLLAPTGCRLDTVPERSDGDGIARVQWRGRSSSMPMVVATRSDETREAMRRVTVSSGTTARVVFGGSGRQQRGTFRIVSGPAGNGRPGLQLSFDSFQPAVVEELTQVLEGIVLQQGLFGDNPRMRGGLHPCASFGDLQWHRRPREAGQTFEISGQRGLTFTIDGASIQVGPGSNEAAPLPARIEGVVYGEDGEPCPKCPVYWSTQIDRPDGRTETDAAGAFHFDDVPEGEIELRAGGSDAGLQHLSAHTLHGQTTRVDVQLRREARVRGRALAADGAPLAGWRVEWVGEQTPWFDACEVAADGSFVLPNLPGGAGQLLLWRGDGPAQLPVAQVANVMPDSGDVELRFDPNVCAGELLLEPLLPDGIDEAAVEVRVFQEASRRGAPLRKQADSNRFALAGLAAGWYHVELGGPGLGWLDAGRHFVDGTGPVDLGPVVLPPPGTLRLLRSAVADATPADGEGGVDLEIYRHRDDCDLRIEDCEEGGGELLALPAGDYFAIWRSATGACRFRPFTVQAGREVAVQCADTDAQTRPAEAVGPARERR